MKKKSDQPKVAVTRISLSSDKVKYPQIAKNTRGWVDYDKGNLFPQKIIELNGDSAVNNAILESKVTFICGKGVKDSLGDTGGYVGEPNDSETWDEIIEKIAKDYAMFGGFAFQVIKNKDSKTFSVFHQDFSMVRIGLPDEEGNINEYYVSYDWRKTMGKDKPVRVEAWKGEKEATDGTAYMYYYADYKPGLRFYPIPSYYSAIHYLTADGALARFYNNSINNGFTPSTIICMPSNPADEDKKDFQREVENNYGGPDNSNNILVIWGENQNVLPQITAFDASKNADLYNNIEGIIFQKIISAHRLSSPTLAGVSGSGNLSGNAGEIVSAYILYNFSVISQMRRKILDHLNKFTRINGLNPLDIEELAVVDKIRETDSPTTETNSNNEKEV